VKLVAVEARISEQTPRDLRGVRTLAQALAPPQATRIEGRSAPFGDTPWAEDLEASRGVLELAGAELFDAVGAGTPCVTLAPDCALGLATLPTVARAAPNARILWLDAHADFDTPQTSTTGFLGCMSLAGACGRWDSGLGTVAEDRVVLCGVRGKPGDFDHAGQLEAEAGALTMLPVAGASAVPAALGDAPVYIHLDPDVLDPSVNPVPYGRPEGMSAAALLDVLAAVAARGPVLGVEVTAFHSDDDERVRARVAGLLVDALGALRLDAPAGR
jgi:arginase family enzyme